ncbi:acyl-CoA-binding protein (ACBP)/diazepam binding inhibitor (DBI)/endozepine (EP) [Yamadazyma tenuis]|uniref:Acyl-CoA-binding protein n=1 Tax=Candida tenuis (strain ATCC 10573 / BCRC 21748 / CBS 615 / JCM 9827 / NBRC 10315 / NRRL Y-1498 / VKM Y-70) TaxID=590646 RepID=G3AX20_CANTC|nr:acyl-CoA-binding protein [Yamadazyma tenuis ATCC 10573]EGV66667.1 acyl-CoA-binding protein [Yamadazyma tenuis ATCC 10573]WEJ95204.1 acyl-CoA-binding protein (ACBP)/diazepam binding inhibitor (DBI)/endozepine (EP) [Yamadazyma tenuis]
MVSALFEEKAAAVKDLPKRPNDDELLKLYGLFKQATVGDNNTSKPGFLDLKGKYKWEAWNELKGTTQDDAESQYIDLADELIGKYSS